jgi:hypothetical protein
MEETTMKKLFVVLTVVGLFVSALAANGGVGFDSKTLKGTFAFSAHGVVGQVTLGIPAGTPVVTVGIITFHQDGTCVSTATTKVGAFPAIPPNPSAACTFTVNADGSGTFQVTNVGSPFSPVDLAFSIVDRNEFLVITTDELVLSGRAMRQK